MKLPCWATCIGSLFWRHFVACPCWQPPTLCVWGGIPKPYWGTWAPDASGCKEPAQRIDLSGEEYVGPEASCRIVSVSETPSQTGPNYSARLECSPKGVTNLIIQPKGKDAVLSGHDLQSLKPTTLLHKRRCHHRTWPVAKTLDTAIAAGAGAAT